MFLSSPSRPSPAASPSSPSTGGKVVTATETKRLVYFKGHKDERNSALICQLSSGFETVSKLLEGESALRTLLNLYNLWAVRGPIDPETGKLDFPASMSGPHHYTGFIQPLKHYVLESPPSSPLPVYRELSKEDAARLSTGRKLLPVEDEKVLKLTRYEWINGEKVDEKTRRDFAVGDERALHLVDTATGQADSLFDSPGLLMLEEPELVFNLLENPQDFDLSPYCAQIVRNGEPFSFDQSAVERYPHAKQHKLRAVTYNYGERYVNDYVLKGSGLFIERHQFIQAITPINESCGGFVLLGREVEVEAGKKQLELVACPIPFGCTLLVNPFSIHGDSTLTGSYLMAMTGNHKAMGTADTVFLKSRSARSNVRVTTVPAVATPSAPPQPPSAFLITSKDKPLAALKAEDEALKGRITASLGSFKALWWKPVVSTGTAAVGWNKTLGEYLPREED